MSRAEILARLFDVIVLERVVLAGAPEPSPGDSAAVGLRAEIVDPRPRRRGLDAENQLQRALQLQGTMVEKLEGTNSLVNVAM